MQAGNAARYGFDYAVRSGGVLSQRKLKHATSQSRLLDVSTKNCMSHQPGPPRFSHLLLSGFSVGLSLGRASKRQLENPALDGSRILRLDRYGFQRPRVADNRRPAFIIERLCIMSKWQVHLAIDNKRCLPLRRELHPADRPRENAGPGSTITQGNRSRHIPSPVGTRPAPNGDTGKSSQNRLRVADRSAEPIQIAQRELSSPLKNGNQCFIWHTLLNRK